MYESLSYDILKLELFVLLAVSRDLFHLVQIDFTVTLRQYLLTAVSICLTSSGQQFCIHVSWTEKQSLNIQLRVLGHMP